MTGSSDNSRANQLTTAAKRTCGLRMSVWQPASMRLSAALVAAVFAVLPAGAHAKDSIEELRTGFQGHYKVGCWSPVRVLVTADADGFRGVLDVVVPDSDDIETHFGLPGGGHAGRIIVLGANQSTYFMTYVKSGKTGASVVVRLLDIEKQTVVDQRKFDPDAGQIPEALGTEVSLLVTLGRPAGLDREQIGKRTGFREEEFRVAHLESGSEMPTQWFGYDGVNAVVLATSDPRTLDEMDLTAQEALKLWVRQGGQLVVSIGDSWQRVVKGFLGEMLAADVEGTGTLTNLRDIEVFAGSSAPIRVSERLTLPRLVRSRGKLLVGGADLPLVIQAPYGLGMVSLTPLELNREPFSNWEARTDFWIKLLALRKQAETNEQALEAYARQSTNDLSSVLHTHLEQFEGIALVSFQWVAFFIFIYILLIGPGDYFFVKRVLKRMELTWITFPTLVILVSVAAWLGARQLKGTELRVNKVDVVDVDQTSNRLRGTSWFTLFSPQVEQYRVEVAPELAVDRRRPASESKTIVSWFGVPEDTLGGFQRRGGVGLFKRGYAYVGDATALDAVPIQVWSMKGFTARWSGGATPAIGGTLQRVAGDHARGSVTNQLATPIRGAILAFAHRVYPLGDLAPGNPVRVENKTPEDLANYILRRSGATDPSRHGGSLAASAGVFDPHDTLLTMMFNRLLPVDPRRPRNVYHDDMDLSDLLEHNRAILVGHIEAAGASLKLGNETWKTDGDRRLQTLSLVRVILPVEVTGPQQPLPIR